MTLFLILKAKLSHTSLFQISAFRTLQKQKKHWLVILSIFGIAIGLNSILMLLIQNYLRFNTIGQQIGHPELVLYIAYTLAEFMGFFLCFPIILSVFYGSKDNELLVSLPIKISTIITANMAVLYISIFPIFLFFFLPGTVIYFISNGFGFFQLSMILFNVLTGPILAMGAGTLLLLLFINVINPVKHKTVFEVLGMLLLIAVIIGLQASLSRMLSITSPDALTQLNNRIAAVYPKYSLWLLPSFLSAQSLSMHHPWANTGLLAVVYAVCLLSSIFFTGILFNRSFSRYTETSSVKKQGKPDAIKQTGIIPTLVWREWTVTRSASIYLFEICMEVFIMPFILLLYLIILPKETIQTAFQAIQGLPYKTPALFLAVCLFTTLSTISSTSISREGKNFTLNLCLPIEPKHQIAAKYLFHIFLTMTGFCIDALLLFIVFKLNFLAFVPFILAGFSYVSFNFMIHLYFDLNHPHLQWSNPQQAIKQNTNSLLAIGCSMLCALVTGAFGIGMFILQVPEILTILLLFLFFSLLTVLFIPRFLRFCSKQYLEVLEMNL